MKRGDTMTASSPLFDTDSRCAFDSPSGSGASAEGLSTNSSGVNPFGVAL